MKKHLQRFGNLFVISLLRSPLHRLASAAEREGTLTVFDAHPEQKRWWRNLRGGTEVEVRFRGRRLRGQAEVVKDSAAVETYLGRYPGARRRSRQPTRPPSFTSPH
jgi:hypothetical protein